MKIPKKRNKIKRSSITCSHIWHVYASKYVFYLDTQSVKVWWRCVLLNTNAVHFCDILLPICSKNSLKNQKFDHVMTINKIGVYISWFRLRVLYRRQNSKIFLIFVWLVLIYVPFGSRTFFLDVTKIVGTHNYWKVKENVDQCI